ncbi:Metallo-hydrolase/oxidoreductase [Dacryopinax primogenitus]|uniref:hydroxyacylglutathione hydrolase n=1 Tax=Dacryopinax primogenitus (strain DJM 731) TaxID=1858805 RepID=M5FRR7_DACPD|nr:Metallo-hydrolase/oxidoreductase [Dacryopinax primogenitus]EJT98443.1 Metallo-hydrolase/oxidoreductase [Dacryopinax primogenitus]
MRVVPVPNQADNYAYLLIDEATKRAAVVDPYDVSKVARYAQKEGVEIESVLTTHHHHDHSGGNLEYVREYPGVPVFGGSTAVPALTKKVADGDEFSVGEDISVKCLATPCHTQDSICYYATSKSKPEQAGLVFTGDTLFQAGCGRFFEGNAEEMHKALSYLGTLPDQTIVYNGHEYTNSSMKFGKHIEPENPAFGKLDNLVKTQEMTCGKSTIGDEKSWNVFMRLGSTEVQKATGETDKVTMMRKLREMKNSFRG